MATGPLVGSICKAIDGACQRFKGSRFNISLLGRGMGIPIAAPASMVNAAIFRANSRELASVTPPHNQLPSAMPPNTDI